MQPFISQCGGSEPRCLKDFVNHCGVMVREQFKRFGQNQPGDTLASSGTGSSGSRTTPLQRLRRWMMQPFARPRPACPLPITGKVDRPETIPLTRPSTDADDLDTRSHHVPEKSSKPPHHKPPKRRSGWYWTIVCFAVLGMISGMGSAALLWLVSLPPPPDCEDPARLTLDMERLYCAQQAVDAGGLPELIAGLEMLNQ